MESGEGARVEAANALSPIVLTTDPVADRPLRLSVASVPVLAKDNHGGQDNHGGLSLQNHHEGFPTAPPQGLFPAGGGAHGYGSEAEMKVMIFPVKYDKYR